MRKMLLMSKLRAQMMLCLQWWLPALERISSSVTVKWCQMWRIQTGLQYLYPPQVLVLWRGKPQNTWASVITRCHHIIPTSILYKKCWFAFMLRIYSKIDKPSIKWINKASPYVFAVKVHAKHNKKLLQGFSPNTRSESSSSSARE